MVSTIDCLNEDTVFERYADLFDHSKLGELPYVHHYSIDDRIQPVVHHPRRIPEALKPRVKKELQRLQSVNVITPSQSRDWVIKHCRQSYVSYSKNKDFH